MLCPDLARFDLEKSGSAQSDLEKLGSVRSDQALSHWVTLYPDFLDLLAPVVVLC